MKKHKVKTKKQLRRKKNAFLAIIRAPKTLMIMILLCYCLVGVLAGIVLLDLVRDKQATTGSKAQVGQSLATMQVNNVVEKDASPNDPFKPPVGQHFIVISITLRNYSASSFDFAPVLQTYLTDEAQRHLEMSPTVLDNPVTAGKLMPGTQTSGELSYLVSDDAKQITLHFVPEQDNAKSLSQLLTNKFR